VTSGPGVVILSYGFWQTRFGGDPNIIGRALQFDNQSVTVAGVLPRDFEFAPRGTAQYWVPLHTPPSFAARRNLRWIRILGRVAPGVNAAQVHAEMDTITQRLALAYPQENASIRVIIQSLRERVVGQVQPLLWIVFGAVVIVLIVACSNVANLFVARASQRRREFAIRAALGARRSRLIAQSLAESGVLAAIGGALGLLVAHWGTTLLILPIPKAQLSSMPFLLDAHINPAVLAFAGGVVILLTLACGVAGAFESFHHAGRGAINEESRASSTAPASVCGACWSSVKWHFRWSC